MLAGIKGARPACLALASVRKFQELHGCVILSCTSLCCLQGHVDDLHVPVVDMRDNLDWQIERGAANMAKIIVLMHRHAHLLNKYTTYSVNHFHTVADRRQYDEFKK
jgi:hypothetical protein